MTEKNPEISWIIAAYNEKGRVIRTLERLLRELEPFFFEIIVSDDGSIDGTPDLVRRSFGHDGRVKVVSNPHRGRGGALKQGLALASGRISILSSADIAIDRKELRSYLDLIDGKSLLLLSKNLAASDIKGRPMARRILSFAFNRVSKLLFQLPYEDTQGVKIGETSLLRNIAKRCLSDDYLFDTEVAIYANPNTTLEVGWKFTELGEGKVNWVTPLLMAVSSLRLFKRVRQGHRQPAKTEQ